MISGFFERILGSRRLMFSLIIINFLGFLFGMYYYMPQLDDTPYWLWFVVIDCPLYVLFFSVVLLFRVVGDPLPAIFKFITCVGLFKYGLWTVVVIILYSGFFFSVNPFVYGILLPMHVGMVAESLLLLRLFRPTLPSALFVALFFLLNDISDYVYGTLPAIPQTWVSLLFVGSVLVSVVFPAAVYKVRRLP